MLNKTGNVGIGPSYSSTGRIPIGHTVYWLGMCTIQANSLFQQCIYHYN